MPTREQMVTAVEAYVEAFAREDVGSLLALFAEDAVVEDPVGSEPRQGRAQYEPFFIGTVGSGAKVTLDGPIRTGPAYAAFAFHVDLMWEGQPMRIDVVDVFHFDAEGKIRHMQAFFGEANFNPVNKDT
ncbi:steroid Delta-isomerase [Novosphingobium endophyticum]|uniref:Steroid Delta-isomerase n=1 Tax=Novosphingobium endophyticum TaxID=1955250 RepID=A0A916TTM0_9SPHN|nr:nuclear transport factor 2 family protein [Novosphingobium endophyticum]GGC07062.1 steroid Delta-isomerase [Novosphingobium endophyticum]